MRLIVLAAGQGFKLNGFNKLFIRDPRTKETILEKYLRLFAKYDITVVVGYKAIAVMSQYPDLDYVYNDQWRITGNSYSLCLALDERPSVVVSSDLLFDEEMVTLIEQYPENSVFVAHSENKGINTVRCTLEDDIIRSMYMGEERYQDPETLGIYKICDTQLLRQWKKNCSMNKNVFAGLNLPVENGKVIAVDKKDINFHEINTPLDYLNLIKMTQKG